MSFKTAVCFLLMTVSQFVDVCPVMNSRIRSNKVSNMIYDFYKTQYAYDPPLRFSFSLGERPEETPEASVRQPALKFYQMVNRFRRPSSYSSGFNRQANDPRLEMFYQSAGETANPFEYPARNRAEQDEESRMEQDIRQFLDQKRLEKALKRNHFRSLGWHEQLFAVPYHTPNEGHAKRRKHEVPSEVTGSSGSIVGVTEAPGATYGSNLDRSRSSRRPAQRDEESLDERRLLQLVPSIVDELREELVTPEEKYLLSRVYGIVWSLILEEANKEPGESLNYELARLVHEATE